MAFRNNKLSVVTFNYDRSLEFYLLTALQHRFGIDRTEAVDLARAIPIVHVYGDLGEYYDESSQDHRDYEHDDNDDAIAIAVRRLRLIPDDRAREEGGTTPEGEMARGLLKEAERIYFLGFGFDPLNLERIRPLTISKEMCLRGSAYGLSAAQKQLAVNRLIGWAKSSGQVSVSSTTVRLGEEDEDCRRFLLAVEPLLLN